MIFYCSLIPQIDEMLSGISFHVENEAPLTTREMLKLVSYILYL